jgi:hypothetical protein
MKSSIFWKITPCSPLKVNRRFGGTRRLYLQGRRISRARNQSESRWQAELFFHAGFLLGLFYDPEDGGDMFFRKVGWLSTGYAALYPRRQNSSTFSKLSFLDEPFSVRWRYLPWTSNILSQDFINSVERSKIKRGPYRNCTSHYIKF